MVTGRTRWRRFGGVMLLSVGASAGLVVLVAHGAIAASFSVSGQEFKVSADKLVATGFVQYGAVDGTPEVGSGDPPKQDPVPVAVSSMKTAEITNLCQSVVTPLGSLLGNYTLKITAGTGKDPVTATDMVVDMTQLNGNAEFSGIEIGRDAKSLDKGPDVDKGQRREGYFAQQADGVTIYDLKQKAWSTSAATFNLTNLSLGLHKGTDECF